MRIPLATYRIQFNSEFRFEDAQELIPYLSRLGISHLYASPILRSREGSGHGYDVVDPRIVNPLLGGEAAFRGLAGRLQAHGIGIVLDIVPNHMAASSENPYWMDVLTYGSSSTYAHWFDIDWRLPHPELWGKVVLPVLGHPLPEVLTERQLEVVWDHGRFMIVYFDHLFPLDPSSVPMIFQFAWDRFASLLEGRPDEVSEVKEVLKELSSLPGVRARVRRGVRIDHDSVQGLLSRIARILESSPRLREWAGEACGDFSGEAGRMRRLLERQCYRLAYWRHGRRLLNYRRFFDINDLVALRQEDPEVFEATHERLLELTDSGWVDGLRVDHVDGLRDPERYLRRLRERIGEEKLLYVEKILAPGEHLPEAWPVQGTTGYEFLNQVEAVLLSREGFARIERYFTGLARKSGGFSEIALAGKRRVLREDLTAFLDRLVQLGWRLIEAVVPDPPFEKKDFKTALIELLATLPVYRTYLSTERVSESDVKTLEGTLQAVGAREWLSSEAVDLLGRLVLGKEPFRRDVGWSRFTERLQQLSGPAAAKGIEDTALYLYVPLVSLNEVGGEPAIPVRPAERLHEENRRRKDRFPRTLLAATTHDTKRSADVRARLDVLSEIPGEWLDRVRRWRSKSRPLKKRLGRQWAPDAWTEYLFYQSVVGIWPDSGANQAAAGRPEGFRERLEEYMIKAAREGKRRTSWVAPDSAFEEASRQFIASLLDPAPGNEWFVKELQDFVARIAPAGYWNSLARTVIQFGSPGVPDIYQGDELWNFSLVDPDNRRPVDFEVRRELLDRVITGFELPGEERSLYCRQLVENARDGGIKLHVVRYCLLARRDHPELFLAGSYHPLSVKGSVAGHLFAFVRTKGEKAALIAAPRLSLGLGIRSGQAPVGEIWGDTRIVLPAEYGGREWRSSLTDVTLRAGDEGGSPVLLVSELLEDLPVAMLIGQ